MFAVKTFTILTLLCVLMSPLCTGSLLPFQYVLHIRQQLTFILVTYLIYLAQGTFETQISSTGM